MFVRKNSSSISIVHKYELEAKKILSKEVYDHIAGGAGDESALHFNSKAFSGFFLIPRVLTGSSSVDSKIKILGVEANSPIIIAPMAFQGLASREREVGTVKGAAKAKCIMTASMMANTTLEDIASFADSPLWFQLHLHKDHTITEQLIKRAENAGYKAIVVTVDVPQMGSRWRDIYNNFKLPKECVPVNFSDIKSGSAFNPAATWEDIKRIRGLTKLPIILKGILSKADALNAIDCGADGIIISNHGGRQLDCAVPPVLVLKEIADAVRGQASIILDGGVRYGSDIAKAIALGADAVMVGRPILWSLAIKGSEGVNEVLQCLASEFLLALRLIGCHSVKELKECGNNLILNYSSLSAKQTKLLEEILAKQQAVFEESSSIKDVQKLSAKL